MNCPICNSKSIETIEFGKSNKDNVFQCLVCYHIFLNKNKKIIRNRKLDKFMKEVKMYK